MPRFACLGCGRNRVPHNKNYCIDCEKAYERAKLEKLLEDYLKAGGTIDVYPEGYSQLDGKDFKYGYIKTKRRLM